MARQVVQALVQLEALEGVEQVEELVLEWDLALELASVQAVWAPVQLEALEVEDWEEDLALVREWVLALGLVLVQVGLAEDQGVLAMVLVALALGPEKQVMDQVELDTGQVELDMGQVELDQEEQEQDLQGTMPVPKLVNMEC